MAAWEDVTAAIHSIEELDSPDRLLVSSHVSARGRGSGIPIEFDRWDIVTMRAGKIVRAEVYLDAERARAGVEGVDDPGRARLEGLVRVGVDQDAGNRADPHTRDVALLHLDLHPDGGEILQHEDADRRVGRAGRLRADGGARLR